MRIRMILASLALVLLATSLGISQYSAREDFAYVSGKFLDSLGTADVAHGWGGPWKLDTTNAKFDSMCVVADTGFDYADLYNTSIPYLGGSATLSLPGNWSKSARYKRTLAATWPDAAGQYWVSYLFDTKGDPSGDGGNSYYLFKLYSPTGTELVALGKGGGGTVYSCGSGWPGGAGAAVSTIQDQGGPVWLVAMIKLAGDATKDASARIFMWVNPDPSSTPDTNNADVKNTLDVSKGIGQVGIESGGQDTIQLGYDEIRMGTSFTGVSSTIATVAYHAQDSFEFSDGSDLLGSGGVENGWAGPWHLDPGDASVTDSVFWVASTGIDYNSMNYTYPHSGNLTVAEVNPPKYSRVERTLDKVWPPTAAAHFWFSVFMYVKNDSNTSTWTGVKLCTPGHTDDAVMFGKGYGQAVYTVGGGYHGTLDDPECSTTSWDVGPVWLLGEIFNNGTLGGPGYMWINPDPAAQPDTGAADARSYSASRINGMSDVRFEAGGGIPFQVYFSDLRLDTSLVNVLAGVKDRFQKFVASTYTLSQNYPNPFNPTTTIEYSVPKTGLVTLKVYNILGQEVATLFSGVKGQGNYVATFDGSKFSSGVYFCRLQAGKTEINKKLMLLK